MKFNFEKTVLIAALALASTTLIAGNPNDGGENRKIGDKVGSHGVIGCLTSKGGANNIIVRNIDSTSTGGSGVHWSQAQGDESWALNPTDGYPNTRAAILRDYFESEIDFTLHSVIKNKNLSKEERKAAIKKYLSMNKQHPTSTKIHVDYATSLCGNLDEDGHTNWYLPSIEELACLYNNKEAINTATGNNFQNSVYWSSTEFMEAPDDYVWTFNFNGLEEHLVYPEDKDEEFKVRCVRHYEPNL